MNTKFFEFLNWVVDNHIPKVAAKSNKYYNHWAILDHDGVSPKYLTDAQLFEHWEQGLEVEKESLFPTVGMGATICVGSDSYPWTIHKVEWKSVWASPDVYHRTDKNDFSENQEYTYSNHNENNPKTWIEFVLRKNGQYVRKGNSLYDGPSTLRIGHRRAYQDPSF